MGGVEHRYPLPRQVLDRLEYRVAGLGIDTDGRLVEDEKTWLVEQPDADVEPALHPAGVLLGQVVPPLVEPDQLQDLVDPRGESVSGHTVELAEEAEVLRPGEVGVDGQLLGDEAYLRLALRGVGPDPVARHRDSAGVGLEQPANHRDGGGLPGPVGAQQAISLPLLDLESDIVDRSQPVELLDQAFDRQNLRHIAPSTRM